MNETTPRKPANRPSRRQDVISAAVELLALQPWDMVTVADIVERAGMTPAAFYYHFSSREQLLQEIVEDFAETWVQAIDAQLAAAQSLDQLCQIPVSLLSEVDQSQQIARIFFLSAASAPLLVERIHRNARERLISAAIDAVRRMMPERSAGMAKANGVALVLLCEMAARAHLSLDEPYRLLGPRRFRAELDKLSRVAVGIAHSPPTKKTARSSAAR